MVTSHAFSASFDCHKALQTDEKTICEDRILSEKDVQMATIFTLIKGLLLMGGRGALVDEQEAWLASRRKCEADKSCLLQLYDQRIRELMNEYQSISKTINIANRNFLI